MHSPLHRSQAATDGGRTRRRVGTRRLALAAGLTTLALLSACSTSKSSSKASGGGDTATTAGAAGGGAATGSATAAASPPAVANATDLKVAPVPGPGAPPAPTELVMKDLVVGSGPEAIPTSTVSVQYVGTNYVDAKTFDSSWKGGAPVDFPLSGVIPGFAKGIAGMKVGGRRELVIPPALGYGTRGSPPAVGPNETLVFVIDLVGVK
ncbi:MAG: hypothetical protein NVS3B21_01940 [Acidimicrobiales bacterium]